jgi:hypothetical protein
VVAPEQLFVPQADKAFDAEGKLLPERSRRAVVRVAAGLVELTRKLKDAAKVV